MTEDLFKHDTDGDRNISYEEYLEIVSTSDMLTAPSDEGAAAPLSEKNKPLKAGECGGWSVLLSNLPPPHSFNADTSLPQEPVGILLASTVHPCMIAAAIIAAI